MTTNIFQKKERQELMTRIFVLLIVSLFLVLLMPSSFDFSRPEKTIKKRENYSGIIESLTNLNLNRFGGFASIQPFESDPGRSNPFLEKEDGFVEEEIMIEEDSELPEEETEI